MSTTQVVWTYNQFFDSNIYQPLDAKLQEMINGGKTDGYVSVSIGENYNRIIIRNWNTVEFAQEWINFCNNYSPVSATIVG